MTGEPGRLVAIGASWGGLNALRAVLRGLPADLDAALVVAQHRAAGAPSAGYLDLLGAATSLRVCEPGDKDRLAPGTVYVAAPDYHLLVEGTHLALSLEERVVHARPSVDVLLESAAEAFGARCVGVVLTGANEDGARGLARVLELGGAGIVQDPSEAERAEMPCAAIAAAPEATVAPLAEIAGLLVDRCGRLGAAA
ncbi:MAG TPA: chemotaxis protein CheB [Gaiellaceae bacterium]